MQHLGLDEAIAADGTIINLENPVGMEWRVDKRYAAYIDEEVLKMLFEAGKDLARSIRQAIRKQIYIWWPLSPAYAKWKEDNELDDRILIATGEYVKNIRAYRTPLGVHVGLPENKTHASNGVPLRLLGMWLEFGTHNKDGSWKMRPRPHWRPEVRNFKNNKSEDLRRRVRVRIQANLSHEMSKRVRTHLTVLRGH